MWHQRMAQFILMDLSPVGKLLPPPKCLQYLQKGPQKILSLEHHLLGFYLIEMQRDLPKPLNLILATSQRCP